MKAIEKVEEEIPERKRMAKELLDKMRKTIEENKFEELAERLHSISLDLIEASEEILEEAKEEKDDVRIGRVARTVDTCAKALASVNDWRNKRFQEVDMLVRTDFQINEKTEKLTTNVNLFFPFQGEGNLSKSPVVEILGEIVPEPPKLPEPVKKETPEELKNPGVDTAGTPRKAKKRTKLDKALDDKW